MPKAMIHRTGLLDSWGRRNRKHANRTCAECGSIFRPRRDDARYCSRQCAWKNNGGHNRKDETWWTNSKGYVEGRLWLADGTQIRVKKHRFVMEGILGRALSSTEDVHHKDGNKTNNSPDNLELVVHGAHSRKHNLSRIYKRGYSLHLSDAERKARSLRAISSQLSEMGRAAIRKAGGEE